MSGEVCGVKFCYELLMAINCKRNLQAGRFLSGVPFVPKGQETVYGGLTSRRPPQRHSVLRMIVPEKTVIERRFTGVARNA